MSADYTAVSDFPGWSDLTSEQKGHIVDIEAAAFWRGYNYESPRSAARDDRDALAAAIEALHRPWYEFNGERRDHRVSVGWDEAPADHVCVIGKGLDSCDPGDLHYVLACTECRWTTEDGDPAFPLWPCPTIRALATHPDPDRCDSCEGPGPLPTTADGEASVCRPCAKALARSPEPIEGLDNLATGGSQPGGTGASHLPPVPTPDKERDPGCVAKWPDAVDGGYDPRCCRFPKSCSCVRYPTPPGATADGYW